MNTAAKVVIGLGILIIVIGIILISTGATFEVNIDEVGFTAKETIISWPEDIPPRIPPALFV